MDMQQLYTSPKPHPILRVTKKTFFLKIEGTTPARRLYVPTKETILQYNSTIQRQEEENLDFAWAVRTDLKLSEWDNARRLDIGHVGDRLISKLLYLATRLFQGVSVNRIITITQARWEVNTKIDWKVLNVQIRGRLVRSIRPLYDKDNMEYVDFTKTDKAHLFLPSINAVNYEYPTHQL